MRRGDLVWINLGDATPPEMGKTRPAIVLSNTEQNHHLPSVVIVPLSSRPPDIWPLRLRIETPKLKLSFAIIPGLRQVSRKRLLDHISTVPPDLMREVSEAVRAYLDL